MSEILQNAVKKNVSYKTTVHFKNGSKETIFHKTTPQPDAVMRMVHFVIADDEGVAFNMDDVRKFETKAFINNEVNILT